MPDHMITCLECSNLTRRNTCAEYNNVTDDMEGGVSRQWTPDQKFRNCKYYHTNRPVILINNKENNPYYHHMGVETPIGIDSLFYNKDINNIENYIQWLRGCYSDRASPQRIIIDSAVNELLKGNSVILTYSGKLMYYFNFLKEALEKTYLKKRSYRR